MTTSMKRGIRANGTEAFPKQVRVAAYTRKSVDDPADQTFTSVEAQRSAIESYIDAQRSEGWVLLPEAYDDTGFSGATLERPAFQRLLADIQAKKVDVIAVHRFDRLSRSLLHFLQVMELFEKHGVSFTSVTQPLFNTATSSGRLMLNVLMSFASYERELIGERTRDKMRAARRKGLWMGGIPPLGYVAVEKKLIVSVVEAEQVRAIFGLFIETGSSVQVVEELDRRGWTMRTLPSSSGKEVAPRPFTTTSVRRILANVVYIGKTAPGGTLYDAAHEAIIDQGTWDQVQRLIATRRTDRRPWRRTKNLALLQGLVTCGACGSAMASHYSQKPGKRYYYYSCLRLIKGGAAACPGSHVPARVLEAKVVERIREIGRKPALLDEVLRAMEREQAEKGPELEARLAEVEKQHASLETEQRALVAAVPGANGGRRAIFERLGALQVELDAKEGQARELREELAGLDDHGTDAEQLRQALEEFDDLWEELFPAERARMLGLLVESVEYEARAGVVALKFRACRVEAPTA